MWICKVKSSSFGIVYKANDLFANDYVAIKVLKITGDNNKLPDESVILKGCKSKYIVNYIDVIQKENELWVSNEAIDCNRVLPLWVISFLFAKWKSIE